MFSETFELPAHYLASQDVCVVVLEIFEDWLDPSDLVVEELLPILIVPHFHVVSHVVVTHQVIHGTVLLCRLVHTWMSVLALRCGEELADLIYLLGYLVSQSSPMTTVINRTHYI